MKIPRLSLKLTEAIYWGFKERFKNMTQEESVKEWNLLCSRAPGAKAMMVACHFLDKAAQGRVAK